MRELTLTVMLWVIAAPAESARFSIAVGTNYGLVEEDALRFANDDARKLDAAMREVGGVTSDDAFLLRDATPQTLATVLAKVRTRVQEKKRAGEASEVFFYYSGHGSEGELHVAGTRVRLAELDAQLQNLGASLVVSVLDACRTSLADKGVRALEAPIEVSGRVRATGFVELSAASQGEPAQESSELGGAIFTHYWASGLRGAADGDDDGVVTLDELYRFTHAATLARTATAFAVQRPSFASTLTEEGAVIVSRTARADARLLAASSNARYLVFSLPAHAPVGEMLQGHVLAVTRGRYMIVRRELAGVSVAEIDVGRGEELEVASADYKRVAAESLAARGLPQEVRQWVMAAAVLGAVQPGAADVAGAGVAAEVDRHFAEWSAGLRVQYGLGPLSVNNGRGVAQAFALLFVGSNTFYDDVVSVAVRLIIGCEAGHQHITLDNAAALTAAHLNAVANSWYLGAAGRVGMVLGLPLRHYWSAQLAADAGVLVRPQLGSYNGAAFVPVIELSFGVARTF